MNLNFSELMEKIANDIGGQFSEYDKSKSVVIVPIPENRYQAVVAVVKFNETFNKTGIEFSSKVCALKDDIDLKELLAENAKTCYAKFVIIDDYIKVEGSSFLENINENGVKEILIEVASKADEWEFKLTGMDVN
jgi:vacuolar-type H+-ATPase subunit F/Vma7